jgi:hypothetical protein
MGLRPEGSLGPSGSSSVSNDRLLTRLRSMRAMVACQPVRMGCTLIEIAATCSVRGVAKGEVGEGDVARTLDSARPLEACVAWGAEDGSMS